MKRNNLIFSCLIILLTASCTNDGVDLSKSDYLIFGRYNGQCVGEQCIEIFKLEQDNLYEDTKDNYPDRDYLYDGNYVLLSREKFNLAKDLTSSFPTDLLKEVKTTIGLPDGGDWGGLYIEYNYNGVRKFWMIDLNKDNVPEKYHAFIAKVTEKINLLK